MSSCEGFIFKNFASPKFRENIPSQEIQDLQDLLHVRIASFKRFAVVFSRTRGLDFGMRPYLIPCNTHRYV